MKEIQDGLPEENNFFARFINANLDNGTATIYEVIDILLTRLRKFQEGSLACYENEEAITDLELAKGWLHKKTNVHKHPDIVGTDYPIPKSDDFRYPRPPSRGPRHG